MSLVIGLIYCFPVDEYRAILRKIKAAVRRMLFVNGPSLVLIYSFK
jgi:hypothetical protein